MKEEDRGGALIYKKTEKISSLTNTCMQCVGWRVNTNVNTRLIFLIRSVKRKARILRRFRVEVKNFRIREPDRQTLKNLRSERL